VLRALAAISWKRFIDQLSDCLWARRLIGSAQSPSINLLKLIAVDPYTYGLTSTGGRTAPPFLASIFFLRSHNNYG